MATKILMIEINGITQIHIMDMNQTMEIKVSLKTISKCLQSMPMIQIYIGLFKHLLMSGLIIIKIMIKDLTQEQ